ncbi:CHASE domain-containing protein [Massilia solisilvae]|uniref:histidine kinase n=1 Tax=Massilia solisilvae TaxID=1811225 RepID=A0ABT2BDY6_9BURK|nr:CHASE domain-containing protein [Massilia solisilvae]MCS0606734.1 CHASE domain-containing protein [Massilia solisilvae]
MHSQAHPSSPPRRDAPPGSRRVPLLLAGLVFLVSLLITYSAYTSARHMAHSTLQNNFDYRARDMSSLLVRRMTVYEEVLRGEQGFLRGSVDISHQAFADYFSVLKLDEDFPGIEALGIAAIVPAAQLAAHEAAMQRMGFAGYLVHPRDPPRPEYTSITHIEPFHGRNLRAFGFDMFSEPSRRAAMEAARDTGKAAVTGKVVLVQEGDKGAQPGFLMYLPVYRPGVGSRTVEERRAAIVGWAYAPFRMNDLMRGLGGEHSGDLATRIYDGETVSPDALLYASGPGHAARTPLFATSNTVTIAGRHWTVAIASAPSFEAQLDRTRPLVIAVTGAGLGFLLSLVVWLLASERSRAVDLAQEMTHELRESYERIEAEQGRMRVILQNAYDAFIAIDAQSRITDWNIKATQLFGWTEHEAVGREIADVIVPQEQRERHREGFARFVTSGTGRLLEGPTEMLALHRSGRQIPVELAVTALPTAAGYGASAFIRDITPRKEAEIRERQRQLRLDEARSALQRAQKLEAVGKLTGGVAHDFNNLLHIISANVQLIQRSPGNMAQRLQSILDAVERGSKLSVQLLAFARRQPLHPQVVNVAHLIERMDSLLHRAAGDAIELRRAVAPNLWNAQVDPNQLENVILNLVINARDAMEGRGSITIELDNANLDRNQLPDPDMTPGQYVMVAVSDTGSGMPPEVMERAFEPFFTTKPEGKGTGLGLSMAHGFVKQSGGHIRLSSQVGRGTTVSIYLPRCTHELPDTAGMRGAMMR